MTDICIIVAVNDKDFIVGGRRLITLREVEASVEIEASCYINVNKKLSPTVCLWEGGLRAAMFMFHRHVRYENKSALTECVI